MLIAGLTDVSGGALAHVLDLGIAPDTELALTRTLKESFARVDVLITSGKY